MERQYIIVISREYGTGGHEIARIISEKFHINFYDRKMLDEIADKENMCREQLAKYEEKPRKLILSRKVSGYSNSPEEIVAEMQFKYIREKADSGESFVIVGRCADMVLKERPGVIPIFITGDRKNKNERIMKMFDMDRDEADSKRKRHDRIRRQYHNSHSDFKWGDSRHYDICINSSRLGVEGTAGILETYINERIAKM